MQFLISSLISFGAVILFIFLTSCSSSQKEVDLPSGVGYIDASLFPKEIK